MDHQSAINLFSICSNRFTSYFFSIMFDRNMNGRIIPNVLSKKTFLPFNAVGNVYHANDKNIVIIINNKVDFYDFL